MSLSIDKNFWQSTNFWTAAVLAIGGFFVGFPEGEASGAVAGIFAIIATAFGIRNKVKGTVPFREWITAANTWNYIGAAAVSLVPNLPPELFSSIRDLLQSIFGGNWQGITVGVFSLATIIYHLVRKPNG